MMREPSGGGPPRSWREIVELLPSAPMTSRARSVRFPSFDFTCTLAQSCPASELIAVTFSRMAAPPAARHP